MIGRDNPFQLILFNIDLHFETKDKNFCNEWKSCSQNFLNLCFQLKAFSLLWQTFVVSIFQPNPGITCGSVNMTLVERAFQFLNSIL